MTGICFWNARKAMGRIPAGLELLRYIPTGMY